jgi:hypothetical protein
MSTLIVTDRTGYLLRQITAPDDQLGLQPIAADERAYRVAAPPPANSNRYVGGEFSYEPPPSPFHRYDRAECRWVEIPGAAEAAVRAERDALLSACDWTQLPDVPGETAAMWQAYRQALRDVTEQPGFPQAVVWPVAPDD